MRRAAVPALVITFLMIAVLVLPALPARAAGGGGLPVFRVDVSRYPRIGLVVTVPGMPGTLTAGDFAVTTAGRRAVPAVRRLSPGDVELAVAPATGLPAAWFTAEQAAAARFLARLPAGERTVAVDPATPGVLPGRLSADPAPAVAAIAAIRRAGRRGGTPAGSPGSAFPGSTARTLETALSAFTAGPRVRRTVVLAVTAGRPLPARLAAWFRARLAASGTVLYVLDAAPGAAAGTRAEGPGATGSGAEGYDALAAGSGGLAIPVPGPGAWPAAFARVSADLAAQYYLRFTDPAPLPGQATVTVRAGGRELTGVAALPAAGPGAGPGAPPLPVPVPPAAGGGPAALWNLALGLLALALIITGIGYGMVMLAASRREPAATALPGAAAADDFFFVFVMPCLNEEAVIANSLRRLLSMPGENFVVLAIDDGSDDSTADVVGALAGDRVWLLRRRPPQARQGKGEALNAAVRYLVGSGHLDGRDPDRVIVVVVDADGRMDPGSVPAVAGCFADPAVGAVQIGVRINNRVTSVLARMQDMEFVIYTEVFQRGRRHLGSVGLGGNGQFMRLSAMLSLGQAPWTRSLTEDLDLGVRMIAAGWRNEYCPAAAVHQQGVVEFGRLIRQRSRWFQGHLQSWRLIPLVLRAVPRRSRADLLYHLTSPAVLLIASLLSASFAISVASAAAEAARGQDPAGWWLASTYALTFGPALAFSSVYWLRERHEGIGVLRVIGLAHLYVGYGMMWYAAGWWAVARTLRGQTGWAKTARVAESPPAGTAGAAVPAAAAPPQAAQPAAQPAPLAAAAAAGPPEPAAAGRSGPAFPRTPERAAAAQGAPRRPGRRPRRRALALAAAAAAAGGIAVAVAGPAASGPAVPWVTVFTGYGSVSVTGSGPSLAASLSPAATVSPAVSHAALVVSAASYRDFTATLRVRTVRQLRHGAAGHPQPWEVGWVVWHYTSSDRFYALTLEPAGWELSKQDPAYHGGERFLASGLSPAFRVGVWHTVGIVQIGDQITVSADGRVLTRFTDTQDPYPAGAFGFYSEDAQAVFDHIRVAPLPGGGH